MKNTDIKIFALILSFTVVCFCGCSHYNKNSYRLYNQTKKQLYLDYECNNATEDTQNTDDRFKAVWIPVMEYKYILQDKTSEEFDSEVEKIVDNVLSDGYNAIFLHVRAYADAYYKTILSTQGTYLSDDSIDVLETFIEKAHKRNIEVHAWINPLRCMSEEGMEKMNSKYQIKKWYSDADIRGNYIVNVDGNYWLNPAYEEVRNYLSDIATEICTEYKIDGFHIDDFFYPTTDESFDKTIFEKSRETSLSDFRLEQTSLLVKKLYDSVKKCNGDILFSISPQGNMKGNYESQFSDVKKWCSEVGYCDMIIPQLYYGFENETCPFVEMTKIWRDIVTCNEVSLCIGICNYKDGQIDKYAGTGSEEWINNRNITAQEIEYVLSQNDLNGYSIYSYTAQYHK